MKIKLPPVVPLFPLSGALLLPRGQLPLNIFEPRYLTMVEDAMAQGRIIGMIQPSENEESGPVSDEIKIYTVGCAGRIVEFRELDDGRFLISLTGVSRFKVTGELEIERGYRRAEVDYKPFLHDFDEADGGIDRDRLISSLRIFLDSSSHDGPGTMDVNWEALEQASNGDLVNALAMLGPFEPREKQALLEAQSLTERAETLITMMSMAALSQEDGSSGNA